jgi:hypothetical protein
LLAAPFLFLLARDKGYNPWCWILAGGLIGYAILALRSDAKVRLNHDSEKLQGRRRFGNILGGILTGLTLGIQVFFFFLIP